MTRDTFLDVTDPKPALLELAATIVAAYVTRNAVTAAELPTFIAHTYSNIAQIAHGTPVPAFEPRKEPAVSIKKSVTNDHIICLEDGKKFQSLSRHLAASHATTPHDYRKKWGLPPDYPMVAPVYSAARSDLAKQMGLGRKGDVSKAAVETAAPRKSS